MADIVSQVFSAELSPPNPERRRFRLRDKLRNLLPREQVAKGQEEDPHIEGRWGRAKYPDNAGAREPDAGVERTHSFVGKPLLLVINHTELRSGRTRTIRQ